MLCKNKSILDNLINSLKDDFKLTDKGNLSTFLTVNFWKIDYDKLKLNQLHLIERILKALGLNNNTKIHDTPTNTILYKDSKGPSRTQS